MLPTTFFNVRVSSHVLAEDVGDGMAGFIATDILVLFAGWQDWTIPYTLRTICPEMLTSVHFSCKKY